MAPTDLVGGPLPEGGPERVALAAAWDAAVAVTEGADAFCAASPWAFAAAASFTDEARPTVLVGAPEEGAWCGLRRLVGQPAVVVGLDPMWGFGTPVVGPSGAQPGVLAAALQLAREGGPIEAVVLTGHRLGSERTDVVVGAANALGWGAWQGPEERRLQADLEDGLDAWWARRSSRFRQRLRRIERDAAAAGVVVEDRSGLDPAAAVALASAIERRGWKGPVGTGIAGGGLPRFYERLLTGLGRRGTRLLVATLDGVEVGYVLGGVLGATYRGFQLAYVAEVDDLGVGHLLQLHQVRAAVAEGLATYDLGMDLAYKHRWADRVDATIALVLRR